MKVDLTKEQIKEWMEKQPESAILNEEGSDHVCFCLKGIVDWYNDGRPLGSFLTAVVKNDLIDACGRADDINVSVLSIYAKFLFNKVPMDYVRKAEEL